MSKSLLSKTTDNKAVL